MGVSERYREATAIGELFERPPRTFWPTPIWWWSGERIERDRLRWQLERLVAGGTPNLVVANLAPRSPLYGAQADDPPFQSERWWDLFEGACRDAEELGGSMLFYDQIGFGGANLQGDIVARSPELGGLTLERLAIDLDGPGRIDCPPGGRPLAAAALPLSAAERSASIAAASVADEPDDSVQVAGPAVPLELDGSAAVWDGDGPVRLQLFYTAERGFDYYSAEACRQLIDAVHGEFERRFGAWLGSVIVGSFQDELPMLPTWSREFAQRFAERRGYDIVARLSDLWEDVDDQSERTRRDYHRTRAELAEEAFFIPLHRWHERHGMLCGFDQQGESRAGEPIDATRLYGDYLRTHRWYSAPGCDHHGAARLHASLAHANGYRRSWLEAFHSSGWGGTLEETFDWLLPWFVSGSNLYNPHATYYSTRRGWWEWAPPATDWRQPYWPHYEHFARAVARLCALLSWGNHVCDVAVLYPTETVQAGLGLDGPRAAARRASQTLDEVVGRMLWPAPEPGALERLGLDFELLSDQAVAEAHVEDGRLTHHCEAYAAIVLPACELLDPETAARLVEFVDAGGTLVAVGAAPSRTAGDPAPLAAVRERFAAGAARQVETPAELGDALADLPRRVTCDVPTLLREGDGRTLLFVPATFPRSTRATLSDDPDEAFPWLTLRYRFDPALYARQRELTITGVEGAPQLWDPFSGRRRRLEADAREDGAVMVRVPFDQGPAALLVWGEPDPERATPTDPSTASSRIPLDGEWEVTIENTLDDRFSDLDAPPAGTVEAWSLQWRGGEDGPWREVKATFGPRAVWTGPGADGWRALEWSPSRGIHKDPLHKDTLGPSGAVPEEFMRFGRVDSGGAVTVRTVVRCPEALTTNLLVGAPGAKAARLGGEPVPLTGSGYLAHAPVSLPAGDTELELGIEADGDGDLRAHVAFVAELDGYLRPEWMCADVPPERDAVIAFTIEFDVDVQPAEAAVLIGANTSCRVFVDGVGIGRHGGFDPYLERDRARFQPYDLAPHLPTGRHELRIELLDLGRSAPAALVDGSVGDHPLRSGEHWRVECDGAPVALRLRRIQDGDPQIGHAWRRPHPLPQAAWLEPGRPGADAGGAVELVSPHDADPRTSQRLRCTTPPGAQRAQLRLAGGCRLEGAFLDREPAATKNTAAEPVDEGGVFVELGAGGGPRTLELVVSAPPGLSGGALLAGPLCFDVGPGRMPLIDWQEAGLGAHSGGVRYRRRLPAAATTLDLGELRGSAEVLVDGESVGVRVCSPYVFDLGARGHAGAELEVLLLNTLAPHLDAVSPTHFVFAGQKRSGLFGPVVLHGG